MMLFLGIITVLLMVFGFIVLIISRYAIVEIQEKDIELFNKIIMGEKNFPITYFGRMGPKTQINLYKYLYTNNPHSVVPKHQKYFRIFANLFLILASVWLLMPFYFLYLFFNAS